MTPTDFAALWTGRSDDSFSADPPNASLTYWDSDGTNAVAHTVIVEITKDVSGAGNVMSMTLRILSPSGAVLPTKMYRASLFIDNFETMECNIYLTNSTSNDPTEAAAAQSAYNDLGCPWY